MVDPEYPHPKDGYRVEECFVTSPNRLYLAMHLFIGGRVDKTWIVAAWGKPSRLDRGECQRLFWLYNAISHFLNSGGLVTDLRKLIEDFSRGKGIAGRENLMPYPPNISMPEGFALLTSELVEDDDFEPIRGEYVFANEQSGEALVWIEDIDFKKTTLAALANEKTEMEEILDDVSAEVQFSDEGIFDDSNS